MKKQTIIKTLLSLALVFMLSVTVSTTTLKAQEPSEEFVYGDANGDGIVNLTDVLLLRKYMANYNYETGKSTVVLGPPVHSHEFTQHNTDSKYLKSEATCTTLAEYYYSCACGEIGTDTFKSGSTLPHTYDRQNTDSKYLKNEATEQSPAVYYYSCTCGDKGELTFFHGNALGDYLAPVFALTSDGSAYTVSGATGDGSILEIPETHDDLPVVAIADKAFYNNTKIAKLTIPDSVESIGAYAFYGCDSLESITIPFVGETEDGTSNTHFGYIFGASSSSYNDNYVPESLKTVVITGGTSIDDYAFYDCSGLTSVTIGNGVTSIGSYAFYGCSGLTSVKIPNSVTSIGSYAFEDCSGLTSVTIPDSVESIGDYAFRGCSGLTSVHITDIAKWCEIPFGDSYSNPLYYAKNLYLNGELVTELVIPEGVTSIGSWAFYGCSGLTSVTIGNGVTSIGSYAFYNCGGLTSIIFEDTSDWYRTTSSSDWQNKTGGTSTSVTDYETNAKYFKSISYYYDYYWYKK